MESEYTGPDTVHKQWITIEPITLLGNSTGITLTLTRGHRWVDGSKTDFIIELGIVTDGAFASRPDNSKLTMSFTADLAINNPIRVTTTAPSTRNGVTTYSPVLAELGNGVITFRAFPFREQTEYDIKIQGHYRTLGSV